MAVYSRSTGIANSSQSSSNLPAALPSMDLGSIIVKSLENTLKDVDVDNDKELVSSIREGIDTSVLGKKDNVKIPDFNKLYNQYMQLYKNEATLQKQRQDIEKKRVAQQKTVDFDKQFDQALKSISTFAQNPLAGFDKGLQSILKGAFGAVGKVMNTEIAIPKFWQKSDNAESKSATPASQVEKSFGNLEFENQLNTIIGILNKDKQKKVEEDEVEKSKEKKRDKEYQETKKEGIVREKARSKDAEKISTGIIGTNLLVTSISSMLTKVGLTILGGFFLIPLIWSGINYIGVILRDKFEHLINATIPTAIENFKAFMGVAVANLVDGLKKTFMPMIQKIAVPLIKFVTPKGEENKAIAEFYGIDEDTYSQYADNQKVVDAFYNYKTATEELPKIQKKKAESQAKLDAWLEEHGLDVNTAKRLYTGNTGERYSQESKEFNAMLEGLTALSDKEKDLRDQQKNALKGEWTLSTGETIRAADFPGSTNEMLLSGYEVKAALTGDSKRQAELIDERIEERNAGLQATYDENKRSGEFNNFLKTAHASSLTSAMSTGVWTTPQGLQYAATADEMAEIKKLYQSGKYRKLSNMEKTASFLPYGVGKIANAGKIITHSAFIQSGDGFKGDDVSKVNVSNWGVTYVDNGTKNMAGR